MMRGEALEKSMFFMSDPDWYYYLDEDDDEQFPLLKLRRKRSNHTIMQRNCLKSTKEPGSLFEQFHLFPTGLMIFTNEVK